MGTPISLFFATSPSSPTGSSSDSLTGSTMLNWHVLAQTYRQVAIPNDNASSGVFKAVRRYWAVIEVPCEGKSPTLWVTPNSQSQRLPPPPDATQGPYGCDCADLDGERGPRYGSRESDTWLWSPDHYDSSWLYRPFIPDLFTGEGPCFGRKHTSFLTQWQPAWAVKDWELYCLHGHEKGLVCFITTTLTKVCMGLILERLVGHGRLEALKLQHPHIDEEMRTAFFFEHPPLGAWFSDTDIRVDEIKHFITLGIPVFYRWTPPLMSVAEATPLCPDPKLMNLFNARSMPKPAPTVEVGTEPMSSRSKDPKELLALWTLTGGQKKQSIILPMVRDVFNEYALRGAPTANPNIRIVEGFHDDSVPELERRIMDPAIDTPGVVMFIYDVGIVVEQLRQLVDGGHIRSREELLTFCLRNLIRFTTGIPRDDRAAMELAAEASVHPSWWIPPAIAVLSMFAHWQKTVEFLLVHRPRVFRAALARSGLLARIAREVSVNGNFPVLPSLSVRTLGCLKPIEHDKQSFHVNWLDDDKVHVLLGSSGPLRGYSLPLWPPLRAFETRYAGVWNPEYENWNAYGRVPSYDILSSWQSSLEITPLTGPSSQR
ncbi:hypothetical protein AURDEDRAFT_130239 [Auricularia subglabra TFB-10046 SS5]|nr:hypothetical protein AURDEDRAFT_130239 [Auricularia subglabra TFB-10046 SS5]